MSSLYSCRLVQHWRNSISSYWTQKKYVFMLSCIRAFTHDKWAGTQVVMTTQLILRLSWQHTWYSVLVQMYLLHNLHRMPFRSSVPIYKTNAQHCGGTLSKCTWRSCMYCNTKSCHQNATKPQTTEYYTTSTHNVQHRIESDLAISSRTTLHYVMQNDSAWDLVLPPPPPTPRQPPLYYGH